MKPPAPLSREETAAATDAGQEAQRVAERYARRRGAEMATRYHPLQPDVWLARQARQRALIALLRRHAPRPLADLQVLEVGCGHGDNLLELLQLGFSPQHLQGNELLPDRAAAARARLPMPTAVHAGDALALPLAEASLDIVYQSTVFSSLLDQAFQQRLAAAMWRWLRPGGAVLWYDFVFDNPRNPDVRGVPLARVRALFPAGRLHACRVTLAPPLARPAARVHPALWTLLNAVPWLRTHRLAWIEKPA
jgi:SAM-dependent methyltransferase